MKIEIKSRYSGNIIISGEWETLRGCAEANRANLDGANFVRANLDGANLYGANLVGANLDGASLDRANLYRANLYRANLVGAEGYKNSHDVFTEIVRRHKIEAFTTHEWEAIAVITIQKICWDEIKNRFSSVMPHIFDILAKDGFSEWSEYWRANYEQT
ncbi:MAG: pentapeptide repeat-containing protein [Dehalococcoidia bacterium]|nr:pentapeptide repeat-containing protein [Dehalococcoidia bacterium]